MKKLINLWTLFKNATVLSANGDDAKVREVLMVDGKITKIGENLSGKATSTVDVKGEFIIPALISTNVHIGLLQGTTNSGDHCSEQNIMNTQNIYSVYKAVNKGPLAK